MTIQETASKKGTQGAEHRKEQVSVFSESAEEYGRMGS